MGIEGTLGRMSQSWGGSHLYPTVWLKAAALLHGLATTQSFVEGNKRTAWLAADRFLTVNSFALRDLGTSTVVYMVLAIARGTFSVEEMMMEHLMLLAPV
ncbi:hypothetical protein C5C66_03700 [Rathayibacter toxicus]|nr:hypothetical protein C5D15_03665 [Rathayibacter toxicus]PPG48015.1 hypothetical protein C5D16_03665 [Rathayibacter toxicus]PPH64889.1 hypothetical protein C5D13_03725 [Rathayibacter toxicus]PPH69083.1 hypothetical protein C5D01_03725 [Rathayibacter toxicus]PPH73931.1 hypothetical protein C5D24_03625 [Rathayibacter toxicus]